MRALKVARGLSPSSSSSYSFAFARFGNRYLFKISSSKLSTFDAPTIIMGLAVRSPSRSSANISNKSLVEVLCIVNYNLELNYYLIYSYLTTQNYVYMNPYKHPKRIFKCRIKRLRQRDCERPSVL